jgi:hypothetical protein
MAPAAADDPASSPWLSVWFNPSSTIDRIVATNPRRHVLVLAILGATCNIAAQPIVLLGLTTALLDWRVIAAIVLLGAAAGIFGLYIEACFLNWSAKPFGGRASMVTIRAALAWGGAPVAIGGPICRCVGLDRRT